MLGKHLPIDEICDLSAGNLSNQWMPSGLATTDGLKDTVFLPRTLLEVRLRQEKHNYWSYGNSEIWVIG